MHNACTSNYASNKCCSHERCDPFRTNSKSEAMQNAAPANRVQSMLLARASWSLSHELLIGSYAECCASNIAYNQCCSHERHGPFRMNCRSGAMQNATLAISRTINDARTSVTVLFALIADRKLCRMLRQQIAYNQCCSHERHGPFRMSC